MSKPSSLEQLQKVLPSSDVLSQCMHCGMCLAVCPTYDITKMERSSPRGRIRMIKSVAEGTLQITPQFVEEINFCLDCQACETACPAGVQYGKMVESARDLAGETLHRYNLTNLVKKFSLNVILSNKVIFHLVSKMLFVVQKLKIDKMLANSALVRKLIPEAPEMLKLLPDFASKNSDAELLEVNPAYGEKKFTVAFLTGCLMDTAFFATNMATVELLRKLGCEVLIPKGQVCCGSLHAHNGESKRAVELA
ncbi:MAG: (Fe-S)-binding protein, partial [Ignavibacteriales bacterium]|nr:(Fe-S)-binding protein [Ignavibacteriales bacterium]